MRKRLLDQRICQFLPSELLLSLDQGYVDIARVMRNPLLSQSARLVLHQLTRLVNAIVRFAHNEKVSSCQVHSRTDTCSDESKPVIPY
jgi:hypothetical protein